MTADDAAASASEHVHLRAIYMYIFMKNSTLVTVALYCTWIPFFDCMLTHQL